MKWSALLSLPILMAGLGSTTSARAEDGASNTDQAIAVHAQSTLTVQSVAGFHSPYIGPNSLTPQQTKETFDLTLYLGARPWSGGEIWINPEIDQGFGLSNTLGVAGFPSAEAYKVGKSAPYLKLQRLFLRQTIELGGASRPVDAAANQLGGHQNDNRLVVTVGKVGVVDVFDTNKFAHDPRADFLNWAIVDTGTFDYAADAWGYSYGAAVEWYNDNWTLRAGAFNLSKIPNGEILEHDFSQSQLVGEIEHRHSIGGRAGAIRLTGFRNHGRFSRFEDAIALSNATGRAIDASLTRRPMERLGVAFNVEQEVTANFGVFARAGASDGAIEPYDFTDIDRTLAVGGSLNGKGWGRAADTIGVAFDENAISEAHKRFFAAGGIGVLIGDGVLSHPGDEHIVEAYYSFRPCKDLALTIDYQHVTNPGYNRDRGPANLLALRLHAGF